MADPLLVSLPAGQIHGFIDTTHLPNESAGITKASGSRPPVHKWLGVPYATAGRWERPKACQPWSGVKECYEYGPIPIQAVGLMERIGAYSHPNAHYREHLGQSEDCHTINIMKPASVPNAAKLPVMVYIHGGALATGQGSLIFYDASETVRQSEAEGTPVIIVTMNYRVSIFGFLGHPDLSAVDPEGLSGNYGFYDQLAVMRFVRANISKFGGDPEKVMIYGESAGGVSIASFIARKGAEQERLCRYGVFQSGFPATMAFRSVETTYPPYEKMLEHFKITAKDPHERVAALRSIPAQDLVQFAATTPLYGGWAGTIETGPNATWPVEPAEAIRQGCFGGLEAVFLGNNEHEGTLFGPAQKTNTPEGYEANLARLPNLADGLRKLYPAPQGVETDLMNSAGVQMIGDQYFNGPMAALLQSFSKPEFTDKAPKIYAYQFRYQFPGMTGNPALGSHHILEAAYLFRSNTLWSPEDEQEASSKAAARAWIHFAYHGNPGEGLQPWSREDPRWVVLGPQKGKIVSESMADYEPERMKFWADALESGKSKMWADGRDEILKDQPMTWPRLGDSK